MPSGQTPADDVKTWLGSEQQREDSLDPGAVERVAAALGATVPVAGEALPYLWYWAFFQPAPPASSIGEDGHAETGGFLPPMPGRQRMWAGSRISFKTPLKVGVPALRHSTVSKIEEKQGRSAGAMTFVTVEHRYSQEGREAIHEQQDLVYREPRPLQARDGEPLPELDWQETITPHPVQLFRYSAVTFNGHRIHYDWPYATKQEGYAGLVVHGPLIATLVMNAFLAAHPDCTPTRFSFRGRRPLLCPGQFRVGGYFENDSHENDGHESDGVARVFAGDSGGQSQTGLIEFKHTRS